MGGRISAPSSSTMVSSQPSPPPPPPRIVPYSRHYPGHAPSGSGTSGAGAASAAVTLRGRATSLTGAAASTSSSAAHGFSIGGLYASNGGATGGAASPNSDDSTPGEEGLPLSRAFLGSSLPLHLFSYRDIKCPVCSKTIPPDDVECHLVMCLTRPRITYNEDVLSEDKDECVICFEELRQGDTIARLPCLCIYHKSCIDDWFKVNRSCPEHPVD